ncbi:tRNA 2-thiouridine(34) synthase MnmA [Thermosulfuriphilus sp.]
MRIAVALSGGVDSSTAAYLLKMAGHEVFGLFLLLAQAHPEKEVARLKQITKHLGIELKVIDLRREFASKVVTYFRQAYLEGKTPNPCVVCNQRIKFGAMLEAARRLGAERLATGHYVRLSLERESSCLYIRKGRDPRKDQSYFLCLLDQDQLNSLLFPLGGYTKDEVIKIASQAGYFGFTSPESQEVCFIQGDYRKLFPEELVSPGPIVTTDGRQVGIHRGLFNYTVGQRRGLGLRLGRPYYVVFLDTSRNRLIVGPKKDLYRQEFFVLRPHFVCPEKISFPLRARVRIRYRHTEAPARIDRIGDRLRVIFDSPQRAVTPGQFAVFYRDDIVLGGGEIFLG